MIHFRFMELTQAELLILGQLTDNPELLAVLRKIDKKRESEHLEQMRSESQTLEVNPNLIIQYGAKASERRIGCQLYLDAAIEQARRLARQEQQAAGG